ncbi:MAG: hypothetical protein U1E25_15080 [Methylocystis sp.]
MLGELEAAMHPIRHKRTLGAPALLLLLKAMFKVLEHAYLAKIS